MENKKLFEKFIKAVGLVAPQGVCSMGLVINKSGRAVNWSAVLDRPAVLAIDGLANSADEFIVAMGKAIESGRWIIVEIKDDLPGVLFSKLKLLATSNRMQYVENGIIKDVKLSRGRIIVTGLTEVINRVKKEYPDFINLFGAVIEI
jgi:hypothetical protein